MKQLDNKYETITPRGHQNFLNKKRNLPLIASRGTYSYGEGGIGRGVSLYATGVNNPIITGRNDGFNTASLLVTYSLTN